MAGLLFSSLRLNLLQLCPSGVLIRCWEAPSCACWFWWIQFPVPLSYLHSPNRQAPLSLLVPAAPLQIIWSLGCLWDVLTQVLGSHFPCHPALCQVNELHTFGGTQIPHLPDLGSASFPSLPLHPGWKLGSDRFYTSVNHHLVKTSSFHKQSRQIRRKLIEFLHSSQLVITGCFFKKTELLFIWIRKLTLSIA